MHLHPISPLQTLSSRIEFSISSLHLYTKTAPPSKYSSESKTTVLPPLLRPRASPRSARSRRSSRARWSCAPSRDVWRPSPWPSTSPATADRRRDVIRRRSRRDETRWTRGRGTRDAEAAKSEPCSPKEWRCCMVLLKKQKCVELKGAFFSYRGCREPFYDVFISSLLNFLWLHRWSLVVFLSSGVPSTRLCCRDYLRTIIS